MVNMNMWWKNNSILFVVFCYCIMAGSIKSLLRVRPTETLLPGC